MIHHTVYVPDKPSREARRPGKPSATTCAEHTDHLLTNPGHDFSNKPNSNSLRSCLWVLSNSNKVLHSPPPPDVIQLCFRGIFSLQRKLSACLTNMFVWKISFFALFLLWEQLQLWGADDSIYTSIRSQATFPQRSPPQHLAPSFFRNTINRKVCGFGYM